MINRIFILLAIFSVSTNALADFTYSDYAEVRNEFESERQKVDDKVDESNRRYIKSLVEYQKCSSARWRVAFALVVPDIKKRITALGEFKRNILNRRGVLNSKWLENARDHEISRVSKTKDISDFFLWYKTHIQLVKQGPIHVIEYIHFSTR